MKQKYGLFIVVLSMLFMASNSFAAEGNARCKDQLY